MGRLFWIAFLIGVVLISVFVFGFVIGGDRETAEKLKKEIEEKILEIKLSGDDFQEKSVGEIEEAWSKLSREFSAVVSGIQ